jgi:hypothetical protein
MPMRGLRNHKITAARTSLPDVVVDTRGDCLGLRFRERRPGKRLVKTVENENLDLSLGCCFLCPIMHGPEQLSQRYQHRLARLFQPFTIGLADIVLEQQVKQRQLVVA